MLARVGLALALLAAGVGQAAGFADPEREADLTAGEVRSLLSAAKVAGRLAGADLEGAKLDGVLRGAEANRSP